MAGFFSRLTARKFRSRINSAEALAIISLLAAAAAGAISFIVNRADLPPSSVQYETDEEE